MRYTGTLFCANKEIVPKVRFMGHISPPTKEGRYGHFLNSFVFVIIRDQKTPVDKVYNLAHIIMHHGFGLIKEFKSQLYTHMYVNDQIYLILYFSWHSIIRVENLSFHTLEKFLISIQPKGRFQNLLTSSENFFSYPTHFRVRMQRILIFDDNDLKLVLLISHTSFDIRKKTTLRLQHYTFIYI